MNLLLYLTFLKIFILFITPIINCFNNKKMFVCQHNKIQVLQDTSKIENSKLSCLPMLSSCLNNKKHAKQHEINNSQILKDLEISDLIQLGIQETIQISKKNADRDIHTFYDRKNVFVDIKFPLEGYKFRAFAPDNFLALRNLYNISEDFDTSFQTSNIQSVIIKGNYIVTHYNTEDYKFYISTITEENFENTVSFLSEYFTHFCQNRFSLLPKIAGLFHIKHKNFEHYFIVKPYTFPNVKSNKDKIYYTKGIPTEGFLRNDNRFSHNTCYKEKDITIFFKEGLIVPSDTFKSLQMVLVKDTEFLKSLDISDYIFIFSICSSDKSYDELQPALVNKLKDVTNPYQFETKKPNFNLIAFIGIDNIFKKIKKSDRSYNMFNHLHCKFKHQVNQDTGDYGKHFVNFITKKLFKPDGE